MARIAPRMPIMRIALRDMRIAPRDDLSRSGNSRRGPGTPPPVYAPQFVQRQQTIRHPQAAYPLAAQSQAAYRPRVERNAALTRLRRFAHAHAA